MPTVYAVLVGAVMLVSILVIAIARRSARSSRNNTVSRDWLLRHQSQDL
jgi:hypothetical protein